jgi:hypothetical protein
LDDDYIDMMVACYDVDRLVSAGKSLAVALEEVAAACGYRIGMLREYHAHRRSPDRRAKARGYKHKRRTGAGK